MSEVEAQVYIFLVASSVLVLASKIVCGIEFKVNTCIHCIMFICCLSSLPLIVVIQTLDVSVQLTAVTL